MQTQLASRARSVLVPVIVIIISVGICSLMLFVLGFDPVTTFSAMLKASLGSFTGICRTLRWASTLILLGLSAAISFKAGIFNLGAQGQFWVGAFAATWVGLTFPDLNPLAGIPLACLLAIIAGTAWSVIPGWLRARFGPLANEVISTLMMNYIALQLTNYLVRVPFSDPYSSGLVMATKSITDTLSLPYLSKTAGLSMEIIFSVLLCLISVWFFARYRLGYEIRLVGSNPWFAETSGINVRRTIVLATAISGALAGFAGACEVLGPIGRFVTNFGADLGFNGITVAIIANNNPLGIIASGIFFGALKAGSLAVRIQTNTPRAIIATLEGLIVFLATARWAGIRLMQKKDSSKQAQNIA